MKNYIFTSEEQVFSYMKNNNISKLKLFITSYVDSSNYQNFGFSFENINTDYYYHQKVISKKTKTFNI